MNHSGMLEPASLPLVWRTIVDDYGNEVAVPSATLTDDYGLQIPPTPSSSFG